MFICSYHLSNGNTCHSTMVAMLWRDVADTAVDTAAIVPHAATRRNNILMPSNVSHSQLIVNCMNNAVKGDLNSFCEYKYR